MSKEDSDNFENFHIFVIEIDDGSFEAHFNAPNGREFACAGFESEEEAIKSAKMFIRMNREMLEK